MGHSTDTIVRCLGLAAGLAVAATLVLVSRVPADHRVVGAEVGFTATPPGELLVSGSPTFLRSGDLARGGPAASGRLALRNITERTLAVQVRLVPASPDLDRALRVELVDGGEPVAVGTLGDLRRWSRPGLRLAPGARRRLDARASIRPGAEDYEGRRVKVTAELRARPVGRRR